MKQFPFDTTDRLIFVNIGTSYKAMMENDTTSPLYRSSLKECTEKYWRVADDKAYNATHVLGCVNGIVVEVIKVNHVLLAEDGEYKGRKIFDGIEEPASPYLDVNIRCIFDTLANFNTKYYNLSQI